MLARVHELADHLNGVMRDLEVVAGQVRETVVLNKTGVSASIDNIKMMSDHLAQVSKDLRRNPWRLLYRPSLEDTAELNIFDASREFAEASGRINDALARLDAVVRAQTEALAGDDPVLRGIRNELETTYQQLGAMREALWDRLRQKKE